MTILIQLVRGESNAMVDCLSRKNWIISTEGCCISRCATAVKTLGSPTRGSVHHMSELQAPQLCITFSQPDSGGRECIFLSLGPQGIVFFPLPCHQEGYQQTFQFEGSQTSSDSPLLASERMVHVPGGVIHQHSKEASLQERSPLVSFPQFIPQYPHASTSRVATIEQLF